MTNIIELKPWVPPTWASQWAHERHAQGIDPRIGCGEWHGHGLPMTSSHRLCGSGDEWLGGEYHDAFDLRAYTTRHAQVRHRLICTGCGAESRDLSERLARRLLRHPRRRVAVDDTVDVEVACEVRGCTNAGYEIHHWLPREVAGGEAEGWPTSRLCAWHHHEWHTAMNGYRWGGLPALERARVRRRLSDRKHVA